MGRLRVLSGQEVCKILESQNFIKVRQKGSHIIMQKQCDGDTVTVPVPNHKELAIGTLQSIIKQSELNRELFEK
ncbi:MAG: type II toxin-antitoxin system HicA family toxin [Acaryochloris sp. RU_4_1]|nr:type II toxin-antitoxin system HicA family toxin [Acaryochloris sp. SU_5_25]NJM64565.1 type II toxin-antitoxin system HicA family toxin [Acaryochloris sp. RU_4_1]NJN38988.1 type II toxin-antitoxin system HicA family toxin [Acaryochloridaceae cyanobacterium CSU_3_4]NJR54154.1 type II toxin-antitoxin system HicA family toxin [Acaryochloris sp. CRU_2_0]